VNSVSFKNGLKKSIISLSLSIPIALKMITIGISSLNDPDFKQMILFFIKTLILLLVSSVEETQDAIKRFVLLLSISTKILFLQSYSCIKMTFSTPLIIKYPGGSKGHSYTPTLSFSDILLSQQKSLPIIIGIYPILTSLTRW